MSTRLFASLVQFTLEEVQDVLTQTMECEVVPRGKTKKALRIKTQGVLVMEVSVFDDVANRDTMSDMSRRKETFPNEFGQALSAGNVKFMLCTINESQAVAAQAAIESLVAHRIVSFETTTIVRALSS